MVWAVEPLPFPNFTVQTAPDYLRAVAESVRTNSTSAAEAELMRAQLFSELGQKDEAERIARGILVNAPRLVEVHSFLADLFIREDRLAEAASCLKQSVALDPKTPGGCRRLGMVLDRLGDDVGASNAFNQALTAMPEDATAHLLLGRFLLDRGQPRDAVVHLETACRLDSDLANAFYALSQARLRLGDALGAREAMKTFQQLKLQERAALDAENAAADGAKGLIELAVRFHSEAAGLFLQQGRDDLAEAHLVQAASIAPEDTQSRETLATRYLQSGRWALARVTCEELARLRPTNVSYRVNLGTLLLQLKDATGAVRELKAALELDPNQPEALHNLVRFNLGTRRDPAEALTLCQRLVGARSTAANYDLLGWAFYANGKPAEARTAAAKAIELEPTNSVYREHYRRLQPAP